MKKTLLRSLMISGLWLFAIVNTMAQKANTPFTVTQQDSRIHVNMYYQKENNAFGGLTQDYKITVQNKTNDKLHVAIEYYADLVCGKRNSHNLGPLGEGYTLKPGETLDKSWLSDGVASYVRILGDACPRNTWRETGTDESGSKTYSLINGLGYRILKITNISEQERKDAEAKKQKEAAEKTRKEEEAKKKKVLEEQKLKETSAANARINNTSASASSSVNAENTAAITNSPNAQTRDDFKSASQFSGGLNDVKEGDYFKDNTGNYYRKTNGGAQRVDKTVYEKAQIDRMHSEIERQQADQQERQEAYNQAAAGIADLTSNIISGIQASREASWAREYNATSKAQGIIDQMSGLAAEGNEEAMKEINRAYNTLALYNDEEKSGWTGTYSSTREKFLAETFKKTQSPVAQDLLIGFYEEQKQYALTKKRKARGRGIGFMILGGAMGYGGSLAYDKIVTYEDGEFQNEGLGDAALATGYVGAIGFAGWGFVSFLSSFIDSGKKSINYREADYKQEQLKKQRISLQVIPHFDMRNNASALSFRMVF